jgi:hypothetical protein
MQAGEVVVGLCGCMCMCLHMLALVVRGGKGVRQRRESLERDLAHQAGQLTRRVLRHLGIVRVHAGREIQRVLPCVLLRIGAGGGGRPQAAAGDDAGFASCQLRSLEHSLPVLQGCDR